eukprot:COSAG02_NODE_659_length_18772_cov_14.955015_13_plen_180_part_00
MVGAGGQRRKVPKTIDCEMPVCLPHRGVQCGGSGCSSVHCCLSIYLPLALCVARHGALCPCVRPSVPLHTLLRTVACSEASLWQKRAPACAVFIRVACAEVWWSDGGWGGSVGFGLRVTLGGRTDWRWYLIDRAGEGWLGGRRARVLRVSSSQGALCCTILGAAAEGRNWTGEWSREEP